MNKDMVAAVLTAVFVVAFILIVVGCFISEIVYNIFVGILIVLVGILAFCFIAFIFWQFVSFVYWLIREIL